MAIVNERKDAYGHKDGEQADKESSLSIAKSFANRVKELLAPYLKECESYEPDETLRIKGAPAVKLPTGQLVIAPDLRCVTHSGRVFWVEAKDKSQRFYHPDTGADLHQVLGWYQINEQLKEPVFLAFQDPPYPEGEAKDGSDWQKRNYKERWNRFKGMPYGNWLASCLSAKDSYPQIFAERTRSAPVYILYFHVNTMRPIGAWDVIAREADGEMRLSKLAVFKKFGLEELVPLSIGGGAHCTAAEKQNYLDLARKLISVVEEHMELLPVPSATIETAPSKENSIAHEAPTNPSQPKDQLATANSETVCSTNFIMPDWKYRGRTLGDIHREDPSWLRDALNWSKTKTYPGLEDAIRSVIEPRKSNQT